MATAEWAVDELCKMMGRSKETLGRFESKGKTRNHMNLS